MRDTLLRLHLLCKSHTHPSSPFPVNDRSGTPATAKKATGVNFKSSSEKHHQLEFRKQTEASQAGQTALNPPTNQYLEIRHR